MSVIGRWPCRLQASVENSRVGCTRGSVRPFSNSRLDALNVGPKHCDVRHRTKKGPGGSARSRLDCTSASARPNLQRRRSVSIDLDAGYCRVDRRNVINNYITEHWTVVWFVIGASRGHLTARPKSPADDRGGADGNPKSDASPTEAVCTAALNCTAWSPDRRNHRDLPTRTTLIN